MYKLLLVAVSAVFLSACSEPNQSTLQYDGETYSGKTDTQPWTSATFQGDKTAWDRALKQRTGNQNEYGRTR